MKRMVSIIMASVLMVLTLSMGLTAMAETITSVSTQSKNLTLYVEGKPKTLTPTYSIDIEWGNLEFKYKYATKQVWDPVNHTVVTKWDEDVSGWDHESTTIKVINNSNVGLQAVITYSASGQEAGKYFTCSGTSSMTWLNTPADGNNEISSTISVKGAPVEEDGTVSLNTEQTYNAGMALVTFDSRYT